MIVHNGNIVVNNGRWIIPERMKYKVNLIQTEGGTISAVPVTGINGVTVTLSNTPNQYYTFNGYTVNGATLYGGNKFNFDNSDVTVTASFKWNYVDPVVGETVKIGNQIWMKNTLAVDSSSGGVQKQNVTINGVNFGTIYYYQYRRAKAIVDNIPGWHLPTFDEWNTLIASTGTSDVWEQAERLRDTVGWRDTTVCNNATGFSAHPFGYIYWNGGDTSGEWALSRYGLDCYYHGYQHTDGYSNSVLDISGAYYITDQYGRQEWWRGRPQLEVWACSAQAVNAWKQSFAPVRLIKDS